MRRLLPVLVAALAALTLSVARAQAPAAQQAAAQRAAVPTGWPGTLQLGLRDQEGGASDLRAATRFGVRYHYLAGGVNTGQGWTTWAQGGGSFVTGFIGDSRQNGFLPVFTLYTLRQSAPGASMDEAPGDLRNLAEPQTMRAFFEEVKLFFAKAAEAGGPTVLHVEPDLWGYVQRASQGDDGATVPAAVASTGLPDLARLPDTAAGVAQAIVRLRDRYARNVLLGYHVSVWGTGEDIGLSDPSDAHVDELAQRAARFYRSLGTSYDLLFAEYADRDSGYRQVVEHDGGAAWWNDGDFARNIRFLADLSTSLSRRIVMWQVPVGNTVMKAMDNTPGHYQDNRVQWLLGAGSAPGAHLRAYVDAGVVGFLFGDAVSGATCACDARHDGVTNPDTPLTHALRPSLAADDDGGYLKARANAYYAAGPIPLPAAGKRPPKPSKRRAKAPRLRIEAQASRRRARSGQTVRISVRVISTSSVRGLVAVQVYRPGARKPTFQAPFHGQRFRKRVPRRYTVRYTVPDGARRGAWRVKVGVFDLDWKQLYRWSENAASFEVR